MDDGGVSARMPGPMSMPKQCAVYSASTGKVSLKAIYIYQAFHRSLRIG